MYEARFVSVDGSQCYLTGGGEVFGEYLEHPPMPHPDSQAFKNTENPKGTLKQWQTNVAPCALHSPYIMLSLCSAMAGYCINFTDFESGGFHLYGDSSRGKPQLCLLPLQLLVTTNIFVIGISQKLHSKNLLSQEIIACSYWMNSDCWIKTRKRLRRKCRN